MNIGGQNDIILNATIWALFGVVVGFIIHMLDPRDIKSGIVPSILLGVAGAVIGGFLSTAIFKAPIAGFSVQGVVMAVIGGLVLAILSRFITKKSGHIKTTTTNIQ